MKFTVATIAAVVAVANASNSQMEGACEYEYISFLCKCSL